MYHIKRYRWQDGRGLTLLEVLVSMIVLAIGILGLAPMVVLSIEGNSMSRDFTVATELAKEQLEQYEAQTDPLMPLDEILAATDSLPCVMDSPGEVDGYTRTVIIEAAEAGNPPALCKVTVIVQWTDNLKQSRSMRHSTLMVNKVNI